MNKAFKEAAAWMKPVVLNLTHTQKVQRLYRHSLKCMMSWAIDRQVINEEATIIRARFEANRHLAPDSPQVNKLCREAEEELEAHTHPDQYVLPWMPGGSMFMRNPPIPLEVVYPHGIPEGENTATVNIDMVPEAIRPVNESGLVYFSKKNVEWSDDLSEKLTEMEGQGGKWLTSKDE